jgi:hypothetical protein
VGVDNISNGQEIINLKAYTLASAGKATHLTVLVNGVDDPVDPRVTTNLTFRYFPDAIC